MAWLTSVLLWCFGLADLARILRAEFLRHVFQELMLCGICDKMIVESIDMVEDEHKSAVIQNTYVNSLWRFGFRRFVGS